MSEVKRESGIKKIQDLNEKTKDLDPDPAKWSSSDKQNTLDSIYKIRGDIAEIESSDNPAKDFFEKHFPLCNKELLISIMVLLCKKYSIKHDRGHTRHKSCAYDLLKEHWNTFKEDLYGLSIQSIKDSSNKKISRYEVYLFREKFDADSKGKIHGIYQNKRSKKCDQPAEIDNGMFILNEYLEKNTNTQIVEFEPDTTYPEDFSFFDGEGSLNFDSYPEFPIEWESNF